MKRVLALCALLLSFPAFAQTVTPGAWDLYAGTRRVSTHADVAACVAAAKARGEGTYGCRTITRVVVEPEPACPPQPAAETRTQQCPAGTTGSWTQARTYTAAPPPACWAAGEWSPSEPPAGACVTSPPPAGTALYFSDCQPGAAPSCTPGSNANPGTTALPKRDLAGINVNTLPAGTALRFARGGAWDISFNLHNLNASAAQPLVIEDYGTGALPLFRLNGLTMFQFGGNWGNTTDDGGYIIRNVVADGLSLTGNTRGVWLVQNVKDVTLDNVTLRNFWTGIESSQGAPHSVQRFTLRNSAVLRNSQMGFNGRGVGFTFEGNLFEGNNFSGSGFNHAIYLSYGGGHVIRGNTFRDNSTVNGVCTGGNVTHHGVIDGLLIENNRIEVPAGAAGCYGFSVTAGHDSAESFRNVVIRGNTAVNVGMCAVCVNSAPGVVIERNVSHTPGGRTHFGAWAEANGRTEAPSEGATIRDNIVCAASAGGNVAAVSWSPAGAVQSGNAVRVGSTSGECAR
jgi:hypothetical protein